MISAKTIGFMGAIHELLKNLCLVCKCPVHGAKHGKSFFHNTIQRKNRNLSSMKHSKYDLKTCWAIQKADGAIPESRDQSFQTFWSTDHWSNRIFFFQSWYHVAGSFLPSGSEVLDFLIHRTVHFGCRFRLQASHFRLQIWACFARMKKRALVTLDKGRC